MPSDFKDHFSEGSADYAAHRPRYPMALVDALAAMSPGRAFALDCAAGTGQLSVPLAARFDAVLATDASAAQIANAESHPRVTYRTARADESGLPDESVDLVTVAQAAHWLELEPFYREVRRVARPRAVVALISYGVLHVEGEVDALVQRLYHHTLGPYWPPERRHVDEGYQTLLFPFPETPLPPLAIEGSWTLAGLLGYLGTWSAVRAARGALGVSPLAAFAAELGAVWGEPETERRVTFPLSVRAGHV